MTAFTYPWTWFTAYGVPVLIGLVGLAVYLLWTKPWR